MELPKLSTPISGYLSAVQKCKDQESIRVITKPFIQYESKLREIFAQYPDHPAVAQSHLVPLFEPKTSTPTIISRDPDSQAQELREKYLLALKDDNRKESGTPAIVSDLGHFKKNFNLFSESSLVDLDWSNVVAAGSSVVTALLPVPSPYNESKRALRAYYHEILAPASDVDLFIYGLNEEQAIEKIKSIERAVKDSILSETTTIRTKNAITIVSEYPVRQVQIVLRLYKSVTEVLTGFDVDCSCVAYDGKQVWASPRALASYITQINTLDLTRRSPSYENRLSKYSHRGFEVFWPTLDRSRIDPTIYERSFSRVMGLARLLVLEKLPHPSDRDTYLAKRREERGRPALPWNSRFRHAMPGNVKDAQPDDVAEWVEEDEVSNYHTFTVPYGPKYTAKKIEKLLFTKDLLLNAEWNKPSDRETKLHRHPAFFGSVDDVIHDCCGFCPKAETDEDLAALEEESKVFISGDVTFLKDDPGRQAIGSFHPLTDDDWTEQAYIGNTTILCQAIVDHDLEGVIDWLSNGELETVDPNSRDHAGRTPLLLATMCSTPEIVHYLVDHGARMVSRLYNGLTALHIAAYRGETEMVACMLDRSAANEAEEDRKEELRKKDRRDATATTGNNVDVSDAEGSGSEIDDADSSEDADQITEGSFVKIENQEAPEDDKDGPDVFDIDVLAWDSPLSPLHLAIIGGKISVVELLIQKYGADVLLPVKIASAHHSQPHSAILTLILALQQPLAEAKAMIDALLSNGAVSTQADMKEISVLHYAIIASAKTSVVQQLAEKPSRESVAKALNHVTGVAGRFYGYGVEAAKTPLVTAIQTRSLDLVMECLRLGALPEIGYESFVKAYDYKSPHNHDEEQKRKDFSGQVEQPVIVAANLELPQIALKLIEAGAGVNVVPTAAEQFLRGYSWHCDDKLLRDIVEDKIQSLQKYLDDGFVPPKRPSAPPTLGPDSKYLDGYTIGSYADWTASGNLVHAKGILKWQHDNHAEEIRKLNEQPFRACGEGKSAAIRELISQFKALHAKIAEMNGKTFREMFPEARERQENNYNYGRDSRPDNLYDGPYRTTLPFRETDSPVHDQQRYLDLFNAAWDGDANRVKALTLGDKPLEITRTDQAGSNPFAIAVFRGHYDLAEVILDIAAAQYHPDDSMPRYRYRLREDTNEDTESDYNSDGSSDTDQPAIVSELVNDKYTIDDIAALSDTIKSKTSPLQCLNWDAPTWRMLDEKPEEAQRLMGATAERHYYSYRVQDKYSWKFFHEVWWDSMRQTKSSLVRLAIQKNDLTMLRFILDVGQKYCSMEVTTNDNETTRIFTILMADFEEAVKLGRLEMVAEIISRTGISLPLQKLAKKTGIKLDEKPQYYQGLTVHGRKREDWAARGRGNKNVDNENEHSIVLKAITKGNLRSAEYFLSDSPLERYLDFANTFKADKRLQVLAKTAGGTERALSTWLKTRIDLILHAAVMSPPDKDGSQPVLKYVLKSAADTVEAKTSKGDTVLHTAVKLKRFNAVKLLLDAGANQVARNHEGENILHMSLGAWNLDAMSAASLRALLSHFDKDLVRGMLLEKATSVEPSRTPLAMAYGKSYESFTHACEIAFEYTQGKDLQVLNGAGDYLLHTAVREHDDLKVKYLVDTRPEMLYWENATGLTPMDVADTKHLRQIVDSPPNDVGDRQYDTTTKSNESFGDNGPEKEQESPERSAKRDFDAFLELDADDQNRNGPWRMHRLLLKLSEKYPGKRKLVSVFDANEVVKRLAAQQAANNEEIKRKERLGQNAIGLYHGRRWERDNRLDGSGGDEVQAWWHEADGHRKWDWEAFEEEVKGKGQPEVKEVEMR